MNPNLNTGVASACQLDEGLNACWFEEEMDNEDLVTEEKPQKPWWELQEGIFLNPFYLTVIGCGVLNNKACSSGLKKCAAMFCVRFMTKYREMMVGSTSVPLYPFRKVPDHVILSGGLNNRYLVLDVEERPDLKTLTVSCSKTLDLTEKCLLKDGW